MDTTQELKTHVALLGRDVSQMNSFMEKLDSAIEKLADVSSSIKELLAVHDLKLVQQNEVNSEIYNMIKDLRAENHREHRETKLQIELMSKRLDNLERWKYIVMGGGVVLGCIVSYISDHLNIFT